VKSIFSKRAIFSDVEKQKIAAAILKAEKITSGRIVTVIAEQSGDYMAPSLALSIAVSFAVPLVLWLFSPVKSFIELWLCQAAVFMLLESLLHFSGLELLLVPSSVKKKAASRHAYEQFYKLGLHTMKNRAAVLLFVSLKEHYAEIIADIGIGKNAEPETWRRIIDKFILDIKTATPAQGFVNAIEECAAVLAPHFPYDSEQAEYSADVIED